MSTKYDPEIIQTFADELYKKADSLIFWTSAKLALLGLVLGAAAMVSNPSNVMIGSIIGGLIGGFIGFQYAQGKAFSLKLEAQRALCLVQTEKNTRASTVEYKSVA